MSGRVEWTISVGQWPGFEIIPARRRRDGDFGTDADLNGTFATKLDAVEQIIADYEQTRVELAKQIARAKRMRRRLTAGDSK